MIFQETVLWSAVSFYNSLRGNSISEISEGYHEKIKRQLFYNFSHFLTNSNVGELSYEFHHYVFKTRGKLNYFNNDKIAIHTTPSVTGSWYTARESPLVLEVIG